MPPSRLIPREDAADIVILDDEVTSFPGGWPEAISTPKLEVTGGHKRPSEDMSPRLLLRRRELQKKWRRVRLLVKHLSQEG